MDGDLSEKVWFEQRLIEWESAIWLLAEARGIAEEAVWVLAQINETDPKSLPWQKNNEKV